MKRRSYPERIRAALFLAIKRTAANLDACVKVPGKDFSRTRKLPLQAMLLMLIGMGSGSLSKELYDWFGYTSSTATASAFVQQRNKIRPEAVKMIFNEFVSSTTPPATFQGYRLFAVDGSDLRLPSDPTNDFSLIRNAEGQKQYNLAHLNTGIGRNTMRKLVEWEKIPVLRIGRRYIIRIDVIHKFMEANQGADLLVREQVRAVR